MQAGLTDVWRREGMGWEIKSLSTWLMNIKTRSKMAMQSGRWVIVQCHCFGCLGGVEREILTLKMSYPSGKKWTPHQPQFRTQKNTRFINKGPGNWVMWWYFGYVALKMLQLLRVRRFCSILIFTAMQMTHYSSCCEVGVSVGLTQGMRKWRGHRLRILHFMQITAWKLHTYWPKVWQQKSNAMVGQDVLSWPTEKHLSRRSCLQFLGFLFF